MADYELDSNNKNIEYMNGAASQDMAGMGQAMGLFRNGGTGSDGKSYPKVDMSLWDQATMCGVCHVGGAFYEHDRQGNRLPSRLFADWGKAMTGTGLPAINPLTSTVWEKYDPTTGADLSFPTYSPWAYPQFEANDPSKAPVIAPFGWGPAGTTGNGIDMADPNTGATVHVSPGQLMTPNVKEMDCLFCHLKGYDNVMASVATQAGSLGMAPMIGAGLMDMFPLNPSYQGYDGRNVVFAKAGATFGPYSSMQTVTMSSTMVDRILPQPSDNNCMQCHASRSLKNFAEMFNVTNDASGFLSSAPMVYDPVIGQAMGPIGRRMVSYDCNAPLMQSGTSPVINSGNYTNFILPGVGGYLQAMGPTPFGTLKAGDLGGNNMAMSGPLYYYNSANQADQNTLKRSTTPFARAEWFKRGDAWAVGHDVHSGFGCAGCHYTGNSTDKNQCDPGRGFDMASTIEDGIPALKSHQPVLEGTLGETIKKHDTRNTVKRCEFCHISHTDYNGKTIDTLGAPDPTTAHQQAGLLAQVTQIVDKQSNHGPFGGKGVARLTNLTTQEDGTTPGGTILGRGNHLDVMDCTVCHVQKVSCVVRSLDATSGMRFPSVMGSDPAKGMLGLFEDPTGMRALSAENAANPMIPGGGLKEWKPIHVWQALGNMEEPLSTSGFGVAAPSPAAKISFRRKIYLGNPITAILWNNEAETVDANGDGVNGGMLIGDDVATGQPAANTKGSLKGWRDLFSGDVPDKNNTAGVDLPIFDPWVQHDLKAGMNFFPGALSVISTGFGGFGTPAGKTDPTAGDYASLYNPATNMFNNDNWKYASIWSGAVVFTEPDQISNYKKFRSATAADGKSWDKTALTFVGGPFMVTHGVKGVATYVQGGKDELNADGSVKTKHGCADCHASGAGFFNGTFNMIGTAIPSTKSYDPTATLQLNADGNLVIDPATGDPIRNPGVGASIPGDQGNMMMRPLEPIRIKAKQGDLRAYMEAYNKLGQPREVNFAKTTTNTTGEKYDYISDIQRSEALYPDEDGAIYYKIKDINANGTLNAGAVALKGSDYASYLETGVDTNPADYGIGVAPKAVITTPLVDDDATQIGVQWKTGTARAVTAAFAQPNAAKTADLGTVTYTWTTSDPAAVITSNPASVTGALIKFTTTGSKTINLVTTDEEGKVSSASVTVTAIAPPATIAWDHATKTATFSNLPAGTTQVKVYWGDGSQTTKTSGVTSPLALTHTYTTTTAKIIQILCYSSTGTALGNMQATITP